MKLNNPSLILQSILSIGARGAGVVLNLLALVILSNNLPKDEFGMVQTLITLLTGIALISRLGVEHWLVRDVAKLPDDDKLHTMQGAYLHSAYRMLFISTLIFMAIWIACSPLIKQWLFDDNIHLLPLTLGAFGILAWNLISTHAIFMKATHHITESQLTQNALPAISMLVLLLLCWVVFRENQNYLWVYLASLLLAGVLSFFLVRSWWPALFSTKKADFTIQQVLEQSIPLAPITIVAFLMLQVDLILVAAFLPNEDAGLYGVAMRVAFVCGIFLTALEATIYPRLMRIRNNDPKRLKQFFWRGSLLVAGVLGGFALCTGLFGTFILNIFGAEYIAAYSTLLILLVAQFIRALSLTFSLMFIAEKTNRNPQQGAVLCSRRQHPCQCDTNPEAWD